MWSWSVTIIAGGQARVQERKAHEPQRRKHVRERKREQEQEKKQTLSKLV